MKESKVLDFKSLSDAMAEPGEFLLSDFSKFERSPLLHVGFQALDRFQVRPANLSHMLTLTGCTRHVIRVGSVKSCKNPDCLCTG